MTFDAVNSILVDCWHTGVAAASARSSARHLCAPSVTQHSAALRSVAFLPQPDPIKDDVHNVSIALATTGYIFIE